MKLLILASFLWVAIAMARCTPACKCHKGYEPTNTPSGVECVAIYAFHAMPCNTPEPPKCKCSGNGILKERTGIWCSRFRRGHELKRWACENLQDWEVFYRKYPNLRPAPV